MALSLPTPIVIEQVGADMHVTRPDSETGRLVTYIIRDGLVVGKHDSIKAVSVPLVYVPMGTTYVQRANGSCAFQPPMPPKPSAPPAEPEQLAAFAVREDSAARELAARKLAMLSKIMRERAAATALKV